MARIVVYSIAYRGDVLPYAPIAAELARRGHRVTFVAPEELHPLLEAPGVEVRDADAGEMTPSGLDHYGDYCRRWGKVLSGGMLMRLYMGRLVVPRLDRLFAAVDGALADADVLLSHPAASIVARMSCERRGIPWVVGDLFPMLTPTSAWAPPTVAARSLGPRLNRLAWGSGTTAPVRWALSEGAFSAFRATLGLPSEPGHVMYGRLSPGRNVALVSPRYLAPAGDWSGDAAARGRVPRHYRMVGFTRPSDEQTPLPAEVEDHLSAGEPPVLVCLGTSGASAAPEVFVEAAAALDRLGMRGIYLTSNPEVARRLGSREGVWPYVPLGPVLPRVGAVIHSGAHGTNAMVLTAGRPSVVSPVLFDQQWHARRQVELGTGVWVRRRPTADRLATALTAALTTPVTSAAERLGRELRAERGTDAAADEVEAALHDRTT